MKVIKYDRSKYLRGIPLDENGNYCILGRLYCHLRKISPKKAYEEVKWYKVLSYLKKKLGKKVNYTILWGINDHTNKQMIRESLINEELKRVGIRVEFYGKYE